MFPLVLLLLLVFLPLVAVVLPFLYLLATCFRLPRHSFSAWDTYKGAVLGHRGCRMEKLLQVKQYKKSFSTRPTFGCDDDDDDTPAYDIPENSMSAFRYAAVNGATGVECDVMLTRDNIIVVMHDDLVSRVMNSNKRISEMTYAEVSQLKYKAIPGTQSYPYADIDYEGQPESLMTGVPTLEHLIQFCLTHHLKLMIELKEVARPTLIRSMVANYFDQYNLFNTAFVATFHPIHLYRMRQERPDIPTCLLYCRDCLQWYHEEGSHEMQLPRMINTRMIRWIVDQILEYGTPWLGQIMGATMLGPDRALVSPQLIHDLATRGIHIYTWVVNDDADVHALASLGVTIGTDFCFKQKQMKISDKLAINVTKISQSKMAYSTPVANELISPSLNPMFAS